MAEKKPVRLSIAIMMHPSRHEHVERMIAALNFNRTEPEDSRMITVCTDLWEEGVWTNGQKAWKSHNLDPTATHHLVLQDDLLVCRDFIAGAEAALAEIPDDAFCSFFAAYELRGEVVPWRIDTVAWGQAIAAPASLCDEWIDWCSRHVRGEIRSYDRRFSLYTVKNHRDVWHTQPSLVEHIGAYSSLLGTGGRVFGRERYAARFIGEDESALSIDFTIGDSDLELGKIERRKTSVSAYEDYLTGPGANGNAGDASASVSIMVVPIKKVQPYPDNPRKNEAAVDAVMRSIERYGYNEPIVVDEDFVVIAGHTRLEALKRLGHTDIEVVVSSLEKDEARKHRIADNKTGESSYWNLQSLAAEVGTDDTKEVGALLGESELRALADQLGMTTDKTHRAEILNRDAEGKGNYGASKDQRTASQQPHTARHVHRATCSACQEHFYVPIPERAT